MRRPISEGFLVTVKPHSSITASLASAVSAPPEIKAPACPMRLPGGADTADAKLAVMEECGFTVTRNPSEMGRLMKALV